MKLETAVLQALAPASGRSPAADAWLLAEGTHSRLFNWFGAHPDLAGFRFGVGNLGGMASDGVPAHGHAQSPRLTLPPLATLLLFAPERRA